jgi:hypothetical protein
MHTVKIKSSSTLELLISLTIISTCLVVSLQFLKTFSNTTIGFEKIKDKIKCQNFLFNTINEISVNSSSEDITVKIISLKANSKNIRLDFFSKNNNQLLWQKDWISK